MKPSRFTLIIIFVAQSDDENWDENPGCRLKCVSKIIRSTYQKKSLSSFERKIEMKKMKMIFHVEKSEKQKEKFTLSHKKSHLNLSSVTRQQEGERKSHTKWHDIQLRAMNICEHASPVRRERSRSEDE